MKKSILVGSLVVVSLALGACGSKEVEVTKNPPKETIARDAEPSSRAETTAEARKEETVEDKKDVADTVADAAKDVVTEMEMDNDEVETLSAEDLASVEDLPNVQTNIDLIDNGTQSISISTTAELSETPEIVGYKMKTVRPFEYLKVDGIVNDYETILSGEYWTGNSVSHLHTVIEGENEPGYYYDDAHDGPCYIEEQINVLVYPKEFHDVGWTYDEGEDLSDWLDDTALGRVYGEEARVEKVNYTVNDKEWTVYYEQNNLNENPKDDFSAVRCIGYFKESNGDYVWVELEHRNFPTLKTDNHVPSSDERLASAKEEFETMISTFEKAN